MDITRAKDTGSRVFVKVVCGGGGREVGGKIKVPASLTGASGQFDGRGHLAPI